MLQVPLHIETQAMCFVGDANNEHKLWYRVKLEIENTTDLEMQF